MGLSNGERYYTTFYVLNSLRRHLDEHWREASPEIEKVRESSRQLTSLLLQTTDTNQAYWLLGDNSSGLRGIHTSHFWASDAGSEEYTQKLKDGHLFTFAEFAERGGFSASLVELAKWWELFEFVPAILYAVNRYKDGCYSKEFKKEMNRLFAYIADVKDPNESEQAERVLLIKYGFFYRKVMSQYPPMPNYSAQKECMEEICNWTQEMLEEKYEEYQDSVFNYDDTPKKKFVVDPVVGTKWPNTEKVLKDLV